MTNSKIFFRNDQDNVQQYYFIQCYRDYIAYVKAFILQYLSNVLPRRYGSCLTNIGALLKGDGLHVCKKRFMEDSVGIVEFYHSLLRSLDPNVNERQILDKEILTHIIVFLAEENDCLWCSVKPEFGTNFIRSQCKPRTLLLLAACCQDIFSYDQVSTFIMDYEVPMYDSIQPTITKKTSISLLTTNFIEDTLLLTSLLRCVMHGEGFISVYAVGLAYEYDRLWHNDSSNFVKLTIDGGLTSEVEVAVLDKFANEGNDMVSTLYNFDKKQLSPIIITTFRKKKITFNNNLALSITLSLYNTAVDAGILPRECRRLWSDTLCCTTGKHRVQHKTHDVMGIGSVEMNFNCLGNMHNTMINRMINMDNIINTRRYADGPLTDTYVRSYVKHCLQEEGFSKMMSFDFESNNERSNVNVYDKNKVVTVSMLCPGLSKHIAFHEAYTELSTKTKFVVHSNVITSGPGMCTFSLYKVQDRKGSGSCMNTLNINMSGNYLNLISALQIIELHFLEINPTAIFPVMLPLMASRNNCSTVDLHGLRNAETARNKSKCQEMKKTSKFPAMNMYVNFQDASCSDVVRNRKRASTYGLGRPSVKRPRAYITSDENGEYSSLSWEVHANSINTSLLSGSELQFNLQEKLKWFTSLDDVEFDCQLHNFKAHIENKACALLPTAIWLLAEVEYIAMQANMKLDYPSMEQLYLNREMIAAYGSFTNGTNYGRLRKRKTKASYISQKYNLQCVEDNFTVDTDLLLKLMQNDDFNLGQMRTVMNRWMQAKTQKPQRSFKGKQSSAACRQPLVHATRGRAETLCSALALCPRLCVKDFIKSQIGKHILCHFTDKDNESLIRYIIGATDAI